MTSIGEKARYVRQAKQTRNHSCHWPGCKVQVKPAAWGCRRHWFLLPLPIRTKLWQTYVPSQEENNAKVTKAYLAAAEEAQAYALIYGENGTQSDADNWTWDGAGE